ncbi:uncharacterized protein MONBRDRAFT_14902, partial [Monosiga brevicollis MX1]
MSTDLVGAVHPSSVHLAHQLGSGAFGLVYQGLVQLQGMNTTQIVAVEVLPGSASLEEQDAFCTYLGRLEALGPHPNLVDLLGHCLGDTPLMGLFTLGNLGSLRELLRASRQPSDSLSLKGANLTSLARDVACGMAYLSLHGIQHGYLCAANVLVDSDRACRVSRHCAPLPAHRTYERWLAPELWEASAPLSQPGDVWAFGVTAWEIFTLGATPYVTQPVFELKPWLASGHRLEKPRLASAATFALLTDCWAAEAQQRPDFTAL